MKQAKTSAINKSKLKKVFGKSKVGGDTRVIKIRTLFAVKIKQFISDMKSRHS